MKNCYFSPKKIHMMWLGGRMPENYVLHFHELSLAAKASGFELHLWCDNSKNYTFSCTSAKSNNSDSKYAPITTSAINEVVLSKFSEIDNIKFRNINELKTRMFGENADPFYQNTDADFPETVISSEKPNKNRAEYFWRVVESEMIGSKNLAAAADFLRLEILRQEGGTYKDIDDFLAELTLCLKVNFKLKFFFMNLKASNPNLEHYKKLLDTNNILENTLRPEYIPQGCKLHIAAVTERSNTSIICDDGTKEKQVKKINHFSASNNVMTMQENHEILRATLCSALEKHKHLNKQLSNAFPAATKSSLDFVFPKTSMDVKRSKLPEHDRDRHLMTLDIGIKSLSVATCEFINKKIEKGEITSTHDIQDSFYPVLDCIESSEEVRNSKTPMYFSPNCPESRLNVKVLGKSYRTVNDQNWKTHNPSSFFSPHLKKNVKIAYDTNSIPDHLILGAAK